LAPQQKDENNQNEIVFVLLGIILAFLSRESLLDQMQSLETVEHL
jgi:hypothetical protein